MAQGEAFMRRINGDFYGNGRKGLMERVMTFMDKFEGVEDERDRHQSQRHEENSLKLDEINLKISRRSLAWTVAGVMMAIAGLIISVVGVLVAIKVSRVSDIRDIVHDTHALQYTRSISPQDATSAQPYNVNR
jgi:hypothetical protein